MTLPEIVIADEDRLPLGDVHDPDLTLLLSAIAEAAPESAVLYVEGAGIPTEITHFLEQRSVEPVAAPKAGTIFPRPAKFHMPLRDDNLRQLRALTKAYGHFGALEHIVVYENTTVLLDAYDAGDGQVHVNRKALPHERIERVREILGLPANG